MGAGLDRQRNGQVGLAHPRRSQEDDVFVLGQERQIEELHDGLLVQMRVEGKVVLLDGLGEGQPGDLEGRLDAPLLLGGHLFFQQPVQEAQIRAFAFLGMRDDGIEHLGGPDELEAFEIVLEAFTGQLFHATPPWAYCS